MLRPLSSCSSGASAARKRDEFRSLATVCQLTNSPKFESEWIESNGIDDRDRAMRPVTNKFNCISETQTNKYENRNRKKINEIEWNWKQKVEMESWGVGKGLLEGN